MKFNEFNKPNLLKISVSKACQQLQEVKTTPGTLAKFGASPAASQVVAGFEAEMIFADALSNSEPETEPDYSENRPAYGIDNIVEFFESNGNLTSRDAERARSKLESELTDYQDAALKEFIDERIIEAIEHQIEADMDRDDAIEYNLSSYKLDPEEVSRAMKQRFDNSNFQRAYQDYKFNLRQLASASAKSEDDYYDQARDLLLDEFEYPSESEWLADIGVNSMVDAADQWDFTWPFYTTSSDSSEEGFDFTVAKELASSLSRTLGQPVEASSSYHGVKRQPGLWIIEPDSSIEPDEEDSDMPAEIVSPPLPLDEMLSQMEKFFFWAKTKNAYTNDSTGLHIGVSLAGQNEIDYVKLALFLGDKYVLDQFGRAANTYTASFIDRLSGRIGEMHIPTLVDQLRSSLIKTASASITAALKDKYVSINPNKNYVEFRSPGGSSYESDFKKIKSTVLRFAQAMTIAADPTAHRQEYLKKFYQLVSSQFNDTSTLTLFSKLATGQITIEQFKQQWASTVLSQAEKSEKETNAWSVIDNTSNKVIKTYSNTSRGQATAQAHQELAPDISRVEFLKKYQVVPQDKFTNSPRLAAALRMHP